jgi:hypothetical protein
MDLGKDVGALRPNRDWFGLNGSDHGDGYHLPLLRDPLRDRGSHPARGPQSPLQQMQPYLAGAANPADAGGASCAAATRGTAATATHAGGNAQFLKL